MFAANAVETEAMKFFLGISPRMRNDAYHRGIVNTNKSKARQQKFVSIDDNKNSKPFFLSVVIVLFVFIISTL